MLIMHLADHQRLYSCTDQIEYLSSIFQILNLLHMHLSASTNLACSVYYVLSEPGRAYST